VEGKVCWDLYIDGLVVSSDGNKLDALATAIKVNADLYWLLLRCLQFKLSAFRNCFSGDQKMCWWKSVICFLIGNYHCVRHGKLRMFSNETNDIIFFGFSMALNKGCSILHIG
jgi:hypothetical protein